MRPSTPRSWPPSWLRLSQAMLFLGFSVVFAGAAAAPAPATPPTPALSPGVTVHESGSALREGEESAILSITGRVQSTPEASLFVVTVRNLYFRITVGPKTVPAHPDLHAGDRVRVVGELLSPVQLVADTVQVLGRQVLGRQVLGRQILDQHAEPLPGQLSGTVRTVDLRARRLVVITSSGCPAVEWDGETHFVRSNEPAPAAALKPGDLVHVSGHPLGKESLHAHRIVAGGTAGFTSGALGEVVGVDRERRQARMDFAGEVWTARLDTNELYRDRERIPMEQLRLGQEVHVFGEARGGRSIDVVRLVIAQPPPASGAGETR